MISLERSNEHRWTIDKNVNSSDLLAAFANIMQTNHDGFSFDDAMAHISAQGIYQGRSDEGSTITIGVRLLQACYYMFGYSFNLGNSKKIFMPSPMTMNILSSDDPKEKAENYLVNLYSMQYPHPFNRTPDCFQIYIGKLMVKLLLDKRIDNRLYIDECIWFLPFIEKITPSIYTELVDSIIEYRSFSYERKLSLFWSVKNHNYLFANIMHEMNYYFLRLFKDFGVFNIYPDSNHNQGNLFKFKHGSGNTYRTDAWTSRAKCSGYIVLSSNIIDAAKKLDKTFSAYKTPTKENDEFILTKRDWLINLYEIEPLEYLNCIGAKINRRNDISFIINNMIHASKFGSRDGKDFENALKPFLELFRETCNTEIISGAGNTDLLCTMENPDNNTFYKMNVDAKTRGKALEEINPMRIMQHVTKHGAKFCMVVAPKFAKGVANDIKGTKIVTIKSEDLGIYCYRECVKSRDGQADFSSIYNIIQRSSGIDITDQVRELTANRYGIRCD